LTNKACGCRSGAAIFAALWLLKDIARIGGDRQPANQAAMNWFDEE
jgi:hypothetical protein